MVKVMLQKCDKCGSTSGVVTYGVGIADETPYEVDLCNECAGPLTEVVEIGRRRTAGWAQSSHADGEMREPELRTKIRTPEELDELEQEYRRRHNEK